MGVFDLRDSGPRGVTSHRERSASGHRGVYGGGGGGGGKEIWGCIGSPVSTLPYEFDTTIRLSHCYSTLTNSFTGPHFLLSLVLNFIYSYIQMSSGVQN